MGGEILPSIFEGIGKRNDEFDTHDQVLILEASNGERTIGQHPKCFHKVSGKFKESEVNQSGKATPVTGVLVNDGRGNSFSHKNRSLSDACLTQDNIVDICQKYQGKLAAAARRNIFLFEENGVYRFAIVCVLGKDISVDYADYDKGLLLFLSKKHRAFVRVDLISK